jgi:acyl-CoA thioesterase-1
MNVCVAATAVAASISCGADRRPGAPSPIPGTAPSTGRIVVLGDSLAVSPTMAESFPARLQESLDAAGYRWTVSNAGVSGDTTGGGLARFAAAVPQGTDILVLALGANDGLRGVDVTTVEQNLSALIERAEAMHVEVLLCGMETPPFHGLDYSLRFRRIFPALAARYDVRLVPFLLSGVALDPEMNGPDVIHPNAAGARRIAANVWPYLESLVRVNQ